MLTPEKPCSRLASFSTRVRRTIGIIQQRADTGAVREDDVALQERALRGRDARLRQQAKAGVDPVGGRIAGGEAQR